MASGEDSAVHGAKGCNCETAQASGADSIADLARLAAGLSTGDAGRDLASLGPRVLGEQLVTLRSVIDRLEASFTARLEPFDRSGGARACGAASTTGWLKSSCRMLGGAASERVRIARHLPDLPGSAAAFTTGDVAYGHAAVLSRVARDLGPVTAGKADATLTDAATRLDPDRLRPVGDRLRYCLDPDRAELDTRALHERRRLHISETLDGLVILDGLLDPESGAVVRTAIDALTAPPAPEETRTPAQRRADALAELAGHAMNAGQLPDVGGTRPQLTITTTAEALQRLAGARCAETETGPSLPAESARRIACDATITRVLVDSESQPLDVGRATRVIPTAIRKALAVRDGGCRYPGCDRPPGWTDAHHLASWLDGGPTALDNLVLLCRSHHRTVHDHHGGNVPGMERSTSDGPSAPQPRGHSKHRETLKHREARDPPAA